jgi:hypothetical protein
MGQQQRVYEGQRVQVEVEIRLFGVPTDPTIAQVTARSPSGSTFILTYPHEDFVRRDTGLFDVAFVVDAPGTWFFRPEAAGVVDAVDEISLEVLASNVI